MPILIVDDSKHSRIVIEDMLRERGYTDIVAADCVPFALFSLGIGGEECCRPPVDLILMDIYMPEINGIEGCQMIKAYEQFADVPVIMVTGSTDIRNLEMAFAAGAIDYITKPINKIELWARVRSALKLKEEIDARKAHHRDMIAVMGQLEEANRKLRRLSSLDGLTGIANRRKFDEVLAYEWRHALKKQSHLSLAFFDIDYFKRYNDSYGHQAGDDCLMEIARALAGICSRERDLPARYGGEEFVAILPDTPVSSALIIAEAARMAVEDLAIPHEASLVTGHVTVSVGVAEVIPEPGMCWHNLVQAADTALYTAKQCGRNQVRVAAAEACPQLCPMEAAE